MNVCDPGQAFYNGIIVTNGSRVMVIAVSDSGNILVRGTYSDTIQFQKEGSFVHYFPGEKYCPLCIIGITCWMALFR